MGKKLRQGKPWMPGYRYSALLTSFSLNLLVRDVAQSAAFYERVLQAEVHYHDVDFGAMRVGAIEVMLHADHTHDEHPWHEALQAGAKRGIGGQFRLLGHDPMLLPNVPGMLWSSRQRIRGMVGGKCSFVILMGMNGRLVC